MGIRPAYAIQSPPHTPFCVHPRSLALWQGDLSESLYSEQASFVHDHAPLHPSPSPVRPPTRAYPPPAASPAPQRPLPPPVPAGAERGGDGGANGGGGGLRGGAGEDVVVELRLRMDTADIRDARLFRWRIHALL